MEKRNGLTFEEWCDTIRTRIRKRIRARITSVQLEARVERTLAAQPLWDYWSSGYEPADAAREMELR